MFKVDSEFLVEEKAPRSLATYGFSLCSSDLGFVISAGGAINREERSSSQKVVERYDSSNGAWELIPELNTARSFHSSCSMNDTVYVFCGKSAEEGTI